MAGDEDGQPFLGHGGVVGVDVGVGEFDQQFEIGVGVYRGDRGLFVAVHFALVVLFEIVAPSTKASAQWERTELCRVAVWLGAVGVGDGDHGGVDGIDDLFCE